MGCHLFLQGIFPAQGSNTGLPPCRWILCHLSHHWSPLVPHPPPPAVRIFLLLGQAQLFHPDGIGWTQALEEESPPSLCCALSLGPPGRAAQACHPQSASLHAHPAPCPRWEAVPSTWKQGSGWGVGQAAADHPLSQALLPLPPATHSEKLPQLHTTQAPLLPHSWPCHLQFGSIQDDIQDWWRMLKGRIPLLVCFLQLLPLPPPLPCSFPPGQRRDAGSVSLSGILPYIAFYFFNYYYDFLIFLVE